MDLGFKSNPSGSKSKSRSRGKKGILVAEVPPVFTEVPPVPPISLASAVAVRRTRATTPTHAQMVEVEKDSPPPFTLAMGLQSKPTSRGKGKVSYAEKKEIMLQKKLLKEQFLKEQEEEHEAKIRFLREVEIEIEKAKLEEIESKREPVLASSSPSPFVIKEGLKKELLEKVKAKQQKTKKEIEKLRAEQRKLEEEEIEKQRTLKQKKRRQENVGTILSGIKAREKELAAKRKVESIPVFTEYNDAQIRAFIEQQFPPDALPVLDNLAKLTPAAIQELVEFVVLKFKAVTLNTIIDQPGSVDDTYNQHGIKSLSLPAFEQAGIHIPAAVGMRSSSRALMVCEIDPALCLPDSADWCCCISSDRDFNDIASILRHQNSPFVTAHPDIRRMVGECVAAHHSRAVAASAFAASAAAGMGPGGLDPEGFNDPFPSVIIGDERVVYSIGPIIDDEELFGRPLIMIRIHNYKIEDYQNGIYFWTYPSFSEGGTARAFLTLEGKKYMKGPDYTLTTFILDLLQVHINKYYVKHFVDKQGTGNYHPTTLSSQQEIVCFFGGMIHLQSQWVHDLIAGRGFNPYENPLGPVPPNFNRHCYRFNSLLPMKTWANNGITDVETHTYTDEAALLATEFRKDNQLHSCDLSRGQRVYSSFPLSCCLTTIFHKYREKDGNKSDVKDFYMLFKRWPDTLFVQGCRVVPGVSPIACVVAGSSSNISGMTYNPFLEHLSTPAIAKQMTSFRLLEPITTFETGVSFSGIPRMGRRGATLYRKFSFPGSKAVIDVKEVNLIELDTLMIANNITRLGGAMLTQQQKNNIIFNSLPQALQNTIQKICDIFTTNPPGNLLAEITKIRRCFTLFLDFGHNIQTCDELKHHIIESSFNYMPDYSNILIIRDSPLYRLVRTLDSGVYRHLLMSSILNEYTGVSSFPLNVTPNFDPVINPQVRCAFLNENGQYVEFPGGLDFGAGSGGNCDFSGVFQHPLFRHPLFRPYIFSATRKSMTFPPGIIDRYIANPSGVTPQTAHSDAKIPVKVHNKMFLMRLVFSNAGRAIQVVVCVSSTICCFSKPPPPPPAPQPPFSYIRFGVDVQFNVVSIGPLGPAQPKPGDIAGPEGLSAFATILATMSDYLSLGCMAAAKKGEYSKTAGYQQFLDYLDNYFRTLMTECFTYVSAYMSPFNSGKDLIMKHFGRVFDNFGDNPICDAIRGMWNWWEYLDHVQKDICSKPNGLVGLITPDMIEEAITSGRRNMQIVVQALFDPILEILDRRESGEFQGDVASEVGTISDDDETSVSGSVSGSSLGSRESDKLVRDVLGEGSLQNTMGSDVEWEESMGSQNSASSAEPLSPVRGQGAATSMFDNDSDGGGRNRKRTSKKTRKNKKTNKSIKNTTKKNKSRKNKNSSINIRMSTRRTNKNMNKTMKIKSKKFPKRIYLYSTPRIAQRMAYKYLGRTKTAKLYPARNPAKKYMVFDPKNNKWVNFGQMGYEDYTKHHDKTRRKNYLTRTKGMLGDWKSNKYSANNLSRSILWN
jgi:hypothetical protein